MIHILFPDTCSADYAIDTGTLESPNTPVGYNGNRECIWTMTVAAGFQIAIMFQVFEVTFICKVYYVDFLQNT